MKGFAATCSAIVFACMVARVTAMSCEFSSAGATFDLSSLENGNVAYSVTGHDFPGTPEDEKSYTYKYAVCANLAARPSECETEGEPKGVCHV